MGGRVEAWLGLILPVGMYEGVGGGKNGLV